MSTSNESDSGETQWKNMRVSKDAKDKAEKAKRDNETWSDYLLRCAEADPVYEQGLSEDDVKAIAERVVEKMVVEDARR